MQSVSLTEEQKSASIPTEGDLGNLDFRPRISLALLLDPTSVDKDWKALAERLNLSHLIGGLQSMTSPTKELLNLYEVKATMDTKISNKNVVKCLHLNTQPFCTAN